MSSAVNVGLYGKHNSTMRWQKTGRDSDDDGSASSLGLTMTPINAKDKRGETCSMQ